MSLVKNLKRREVEIFGAKRVVRNETKKTPEIKEEEKTETEVKKTPQNKTKKKTEV